MTTQSNSTTAVGAPAKTSDLIYPLDATPPFGITLLAALQHILCTDRMATMYILPDGTAQAAEEDEEEEE